MEWCFLKKCPSLKELNLKDAFSHYRKSGFLNALPNLEELTPHSLSFLLGEEAADTHTRMQNFPHLRRLHLREHKIDNAGLKRLSDLLPTIEELDVGDSHIQSDDADEGSLQTQGHILLGSFSRLTKLNALYNRNLKHMPVFANPTLLTQLILRDCVIKSFEGLNQCINLRHLDVTNNPVTVAHAWQHMTNLQQLRTLHFSQKGYAPRYDDQSRADCINVLKKNTHLTTLNLNGHPIGPTVADVLANKDDLRILQLGACGLGDDGFQKLPLLNLEELGVSMNELTAQSVRHLCLTLKQVNTPHLKHLNLTYNTLGDDVMLDLATLTSLKKLFLNGTGITEQGARHLAPLVIQLHKHDCKDFVPFFIRYCQSLERAAEHRGVPRAAGHAFAMTAWFVIARRNVCFDAAIQCALANSMALHMDRHRLAPSRLQKVACAITCKLGLAQKITAHRVHLARFGAAGIRLHGINALKGRAQVFKKGGLL